jgi:hypothetical protein
MSKRGAEGQGGEDRYGSWGNAAAMDEKPKAATAAQMAKRK